MRPSISTNRTLAHKFIIANLREDLRPDDPVDGTDDKDAQAHNTVEIVWEIVIHVLSSIRRNIWGDDKEEVGQKEEHCDWKCGAERWCPLLRVAMWREGLEV